MTDTTNCGRPLATAERRSDSQKAELAHQALRDAVERELAALPKQQKVYAAANDFLVANNFRPARGCRPIHVLRRGDVRQPLAAAAPGGEDDGDRRDRRECDELLAGSAH